MSQKKNIIKDFWESFLSVSKFDKLMLITVFLIIAVTPYIVANNQIFTSKAAGSLVSITSGNWSDPSVWTTGAVPTSSDSVTIESGHTINYDVLSDNILGPLTIKGTLKFSRTINTRLKLSDNLMVMMGGFLDMGTPNDFIPKNIKSEVIFVLTQAQADAYVGGPSFQATDKGLWVMTEGRWEVYGFPLVRTWSKIASDASAGSTSVIVDNDVSDWYVGGTVVITQTSNPGRPIFVPKLNSFDIKYAFENELRNITALEKQVDGKTKITLDNPLSFKHEGTVPFKGEVGLLTRNILFKTELLGANETDLQNDVGLRKFAHTMRMSGSKGDTQYAEFKYMGHYGKLARYTVHPHLMGATSNGMVIRGNGLWYTGFRWINIHSSDGILMEDNVGFSSAGVGYFVEIDPINDERGIPVGLASISQNLAFIHNLGVETMSSRFDDRGGIVEFWRLSAFWLSESQGEAFLGNVAVGTRSGGSGEASGYWDDQSSGGPGDMGKWFIQNEAHANEANGHSTWSNFQENTEDYIDSFSWRNGGGGFGLGAYTGEYYVHNAKLLENNEVGVASSIVDVFVQDSLITGPSADGSRGTGGFIGAYFADQSPNRPHVNLRNTYKNLAVGYSHLHDVCNDAILEKQVLTTKCSADYSYVIGNTFENVGKPIDFGWHANANTWHKLAGNIGVDASLQGNLYLNRKDQNVVANQGPESAAIVGDGSKSSYNAPSDALLTPISTPWADLPPQIALAVTTTGKTATMKATVTDDKNPNPTVEFYADWNKIATKTAPPYEITVDLVNLPGTFSIAPRRYVYLWARALDGASFLRGTKSPYAQRAYSDATELGPEVLAPIIPTPTLTPTEVPVATPTPTNTATPTSAPTPTSIPTPTSPIPPTPTSIPLPTPIPIPIACVITSASWDTPSNPVVEGTTVKLTVKTNNAPSCTGKNVAFQVWENDSILEGAIDDPANTLPPIATVTGNTVTTTWVSEWQNDCGGLCNPPEYFFKANIVGDANDVRSNDPLLQVDKAAILVISTTPQVTTTINSATITWNTNKPSSSRVMYGVIKQYTKLTAEQNIANPTTSHSITIPDLNKCTVYRYIIVISKEISNPSKITSSDSKFVTLGCNASVLDTQEGDTITDKLTGGTLNLLDSTLLGLTLSIPPSFLTTNNANFQILKLNASEFANSIIPPQGLTTIGNNTYHLNAIGEDEKTSISSFNKDITITIDYTATDINNIDEDSLTIKRWDGTAWNELTNCTLNKQEKTITCTTTNFSDFVLFGKSLTPTPTPTQAPSYLTPSYGTPSYGTPSSGGGGGGGGGGYGTPSYGTPPTSGSNTADLNKDGKVNIFDLSILLRNWNKSGQGDLNGDGKVNIFDLSILLRSWSK